LPEVLDEAALLVNPENVFEIARAMKTLLTDQVLRQQTIERGVEQVKKFSWKMAAESVLATYRDVAGETRSEAVAETTG
jgi:glycosyltransferase involved in cell wall biosynthesis